MRVDTYDEALRLVNESPYGNGTAALHPRRRRPPGSFQFRGRGGDGRDQRPDPGAGRPTTRSAAGTDSLFRRQPHLRAGRDPLSNTRGKVVTRPVARPPPRAKVDLGFPQTRLASLESWVPGPPRHHAFERGRRRMRDDLQRMHVRYELVLALTWLRRRGRSARACSAWGGPPEVPGLAKHKCGAVCSTGLPGRASRGCCSCIREGRSYARPRRGRVVAAEGRGRAGGGSARGRPSGVRGGARAFPAAPSSGARSSRSATVRQKGGKLVTRVVARRRRLRCVPRSRANTFPARVAAAVRARCASSPEVDRAGWFELVEAAA